MSVKADGPVGLNKLSKSVCQSAKWFRFNRPPPFFLALPPSSVPSEEDTPLLLAMAQSCQLQTIIIFS